MKVVKLNDAEFREALLVLRKRGGVFQKAAEEAARMITHFDLDISEVHQITNHGEKRIKHCVKYDLPGACRLVTVQNEGVTYVLFVGDHTSVDRWLDRHEGLTLSCDIETMRVKVVHVNRVVHEWKQPDIQEHAPQIDYRGMTGRQREEARKWLRDHKPQTFEQWLKPSNLMELRASQFVSLRGIEKAQLFTLDKELQNNGVVGFMNM